MNLIKNRQTMPNWLSASLGRFEGPFSPTMNLINVASYVPQKINVHCLVGDPNIELFSS